MGVNGTNMTQEQWDSNVASIRKGMQTATPTTGIPAGVDPAYHASVVQSYNDSLLRRPADQASANTAIAQEKTANPAAWGIPPTITEKPPTQMSSANNMPTAQPMSTQQVAPPDYAALAAARFAASLAQKRTIAQQQKTSADTAYQQQTLRTNDNRTLQDFSRTQTANPFGNMGRKSFSEGLIGRERTQADADSAASLASQKSNIDQLLASYESATADEQVRIADELQARDQQYQLSLAQLSGQLPGGGQTLAAKGQDQTYGLNLAGLTGTIGGQQTMASKQLGLQAQNQQFNQEQVVKQQHIDLADKLTQQFGVLVKPTSDPMESYAQVAGLSTVVAQKFAEDVKQQGFDNTIKYALANNTITQTQANIMHEAQQISISQQNANTSAASQGTSANNAEQTRLMNVWQATGKAPKGIPGVAEGTPIYEKPTADKPKVIDYKTDPNFAADVAHLKSSPADAAKLDSNSEPFIKEYGYDGYLALRKAAGLD